MSDYALVPVEHQPDFGSVSLVPVEHDPFSEDGVTQQAQSQQAQTQPAQNGPQPATGVERLYVSPRRENTQADGSWNPDNENSATSEFGRSTASTPTQDNPDYDKSRFQPFGELKPATFTPTQQIGYLAADGLMALGMKPYAANDWATRLGNLLNLIPPVAAAGSLLDFIDAKRRDDLPGALVAAAGMIPGAKGVARGVVANAVHRHHPWPMYLGGAVKQELVSLPKSLHIEFHRRLDERLPKQWGTAFYQNQSPAERQQTLQELAAHIKKFDADHGTKLYDALLKNGFPAP